jgi:hypothetical protein
MWRARLHVCPGPQQLSLGGWLVLGMLMCIVIPQGMLMAQPHAAVRAPEFPEGMQWLNEEVIKVAPQQVKAGAAGKILVHLHFPEGYHLNPRAPLNYSVNVSGEGIGIAEADRVSQTIAPSLPLAIPFQAAAGTHQAAADIDMTFYYCREDDTGVCVIQSVRWQVPLHTDPEASVTEAVVSYQAEVPEIQKQL